MAVGWGVSVGGGTVGVAVGGVVGVGVGRGVDVAGGSGVLVGVGVGVGAELQPLTTGSRISPPTTQRHNRVLILETVLASIMIFLTSGK